MLDVAKRAGVSLSTVSYALNGKRPISEETRQRVTTAIKELGYRPHPFAQGLAAGRSNVLAILFPAIERGLGFTELEFVANAAHTASKKGYHLVLWQTESNDPAELGELTQQGLVGGVILMEIHEHDERVRLLQELNFPFSIIGRCEECDSNFVDIEFKQTMDDALTHLTMLGHSHIAFINQSQASYEAGYGPVVRTTQAFEDYIRKDALTGMVRFCHPSKNAGYEAFNALIDEDPNLTAVVTMNERAIPGIMSAIADHGWKIPDDFSIIIIVTSTRTAEMVVPKLTTFEPPSAELSCLATELLIKQLEGTGEEHSGTLIPCHLVVGDSSGPCRRNYRPQDPFGKEVPPLRAG